MRPEIATTQTATAMDEGRNKQEWRRVEVVMGVCPGPVSNARLRLILKMSMTECFFQAEAVADLEL